MNSKDTLDHIDDHNHIEKSLYSHAESPEIAEIWSIVPSPPLGIYRVLRELLNKVNALLIRKL